MLKSRIIHLFTIAVASILFVVGLYYYASYTRNKKNNFVREFPPHKLTADTVKKLNYSDLYIAGSDGHSVYLSSRKGKNLLIGYNLNTLDSTAKKIVAKQDFTVFDDAELKVSEDNFFLTQGLAGNIRSGSLQDFMLHKSYNVFPFNSATPLSDTTFVLSYLNKKKRNALGIFSTRDQNVTEKKILKEQGEGIFSTDGILLNDPNGHIIYVYYYRNQFILADNQFNIKYTGNTIDTNSMAKIKVNKISSSGDLTMAAPPLQVNKDACANADYLFVWSGLKADNQLPEVWSKASTIDVYRLRDGKYQFSFDLPHLDDDKLVSFKVYGKTLVALYHRFIYTFKLNF